MNRAHWIHFTHSIRADTRSFRAIYGGWPCFVRRFENAGIRWQIDRSIDRSTPQGRSFIWAKMSDRPQALRAQRLESAAALRRNGDKLGARFTLNVLRANR